MEASDFTLLLRKIALGIVVTVIPLLIIGGGIWLTQRVLNPSKPLPH